MNQSVFAARYEILQNLEGGPLFQSSKAMDLQSGREVRLRILDESYVHETSFVQALLSHIQDIQSLNHPGLEKILDSFQDNGVVAMVTEYVPSVPLDERVKRLASFSVQLAVSTAVSLVEAVVALHQAGFIHGDISGRNVHVSQSGSVKLSMSGFWKTYGQSQRAGMAMLRGMAPYLAPEVTSGSMPAISTDIYAIGVLIFQMLAGRFPFSGDTTVSIANKHATAPCPSLKTINPSVPGALDELVKRCLDKSPNQRYTSAQDLLTDLRTIQDALRFGRPMTWPLKKTDYEPNQVAPIVETPEEKPKRKKEMTAKAKKDRSESDDVPRWVTGVFYVCIIAILMAIGAWAAFNVRQPKLIDLPNLVYKSQQEAATELKKLGLRLSVEKQIASEKYPMGVVLEQDPIPGSKKVKEGGIVQVVISAGGRFVEVPDLRGRSLDDSKALLAKLNLEIGEPINKVRDKELAAGMVISQIPEARKKVERGSRIKIVVSNGDQRVKDESESMTRYTYKLKLKMPPGADPVLVRVDMSDDRETRTILEEQHEPSESIEVEADGYGKEAIFRVFFDGELVTQKTVKAEDEDSGRGNQQ